MRIRNGALVVMALLAAGAGGLVGCSAAVSPGPPEADSPTPSTPGESSPVDGEVAQIAQLVMDRYEMVRSGDYAAACALYSEKFAEQFVELAEVAGGGCVEAHRAGVEDAETALAAAVAQHRAGLMPFFYIPSDIRVDPAAIEITVSGGYLADGTIVSLDPAEFDDGQGETPGWMVGADYVKRDGDGTWKFVTMPE